jgi:hypothetical protein
LLKILHVWLDRASLPRRALTLASQGRDSRNNPRRTANIIAGYRIVDSGSVSLCAWVTMSPEVQQAHSDGLNIVAG